MRAVACLPCHYTTLWHAIHAKNLGIKCSVFITSLASDLNSLAWSICQSPTREFASLLSKTIELKAASHKPVVRVILYKPAVDWIKIRCARLSWASWTQFGAWANMGWRSSRITEDEPSSFGGSAKKCQSESNSYTRIQMDIPIGSSSKSASLAFSALSRLPYCPPFVHQAVFNLKVPHACPAGLADWLHRQDPTAVCCLHKVKVSSNIVIPYTHKRQWTEDVIWTQHLLSLSSLKDRTGFVSRDAKFYIENQHSNYMKDHVLSTLKLFPLYHWKLPRAMRVDFLYVEEKH